MKIPVEEQLMAAQIDLVKAEAIQKLAGAVFTLNQEGYSDVAKKVTTYLESLVTTEKETGSSPTT